MKSNEINIKSSTIEKGLDLAKDFLSKLISPTAEEVGLLLSDNIKFLRFKHQVRVLLRAKKYVEDRGISVKEIPIKILVPLLEKASLETDEVIQDKWANMLVNMVDSATNLQNQIFPYLLSQISIEEFNELKELSENEKKHREKKRELAILKGNELQLDKEIKDLYEAVGKIGEQILLLNHKEFNALNESTEKKKREKENELAILFDKRLKFSKPIQNLQEKVNKIEQEGFLLDLEEFERANLSRLGLIRLLPPRIYIEEFSTGGGDDPNSEQWHQIEAEYDSDSFAYRITELGQKFIAVCELKDNKGN